MGGTAQYSLQIGRRRISWNEIRPHLRAALELDRPERARTPDARYLAEYLHADTPTLAQYFLAKARLLQIWQALQ